MIWGETLGDKGVPSVVPVMSAIARIFVCHATARSITIFKFIFS
jgi:hypothetical protein